MRRNSFLPDELSSEVGPAIVMGHGFASVKEMIPSATINYFIDAGFIVMAIDYRFLGDSKGTRVALLADLAEADRDRLFFPPP